MSYGLNIRNVLLMRATFKLLRPKFIQVYLQKTLGECVFCQRELIYSVCVKFRPSAISP